MSARTAACWLCLALAACQRPAPGPRESDARSEVRTAPAPTAAAATQAAAQSYAGWYLRHGGGARFQPCGQDAAWRVEEQGTDLAERARAFGLDDDMPVYVRLHGTRQGDALLVQRVEQFGSDTPVRECAMTGVVTHD